MQEETRKYGLATAVAMIIGIVIGSGIFFKADDILSMTDGNVAMGCLVLILGAAGIIFGGITMAEWAKVTDDAGGLISYGGKAFGEIFAFLIGWFQMTIYFPALLSVVSWAGANYTLMLFSNVEFLQGKIWELTLGYIVLFYLLNTFSAKAAGHFQTGAMIIKLIPLLLVGILGVLFGDVGGAVSQPVTAAGLMAGSSAVVAAGFSYDGWTVAPSICHEIRNARRNLPLALTIAPVIIMAVYLVYFLGINALLGPEQVMEYQDGAFLAAAAKLVGPNLAKLLLVGVVISVLGTVNGLILGCSRVPHALAVRRELPCSRKVSEIHGNFQVSLPSHAISFLFSVLWIGIHYMLTEFPQFKGMNLDVSGIPIVLMYIFYLILYVGVIIRARKGLVSGVFYGYISPVLASAGGLLIIYGGMSSENGFLYLVISLIALGSGLVMKKIMGTKK